MSDPRGILRAVPKPRKRKARAPKRMTRTRMKCRGARTKKSGGAGFWKVKHPAFRRWLRTENHCLLAGAWLKRRVSLHDVPSRADATWWHFCWGPIDPAHVGEHQARGAPDLGHCVPLCRAAHQFYDEHRSAWPKVTGLTEKRMANEAGGYALRYVERGGKVA